MLACGTEGFETPPPPQPDELYWELALNHHAVTMALGNRYDTLTLAAVPRSVTGRALAELPAPVYESRDITRLVVTPDGVLHAIAAGAQPVWVVATLTAGNIKHADSVRVRVVDVAEPPVLTTFSVQPVPPDSAKVAMRVLYMPPLPVHATDDHGQPMSDLMVAFRTSNRQVARIDPITGSISGLSPGKVTFSASTTAFGVAKMDSVLYRIGAPIEQFIGVSWPTQGGTNFSILKNPTSTVGVGAIVAFLSYGYSPELSFEFDDADLPNVGPGVNFSEFNRSIMSYQCAASPLDCAGAGNVVVTPPANAEPSVYGGARIFTAPGTYEYRCVPCGLVGRIVVVDEREP